MVRIVSRFSNLLKQTTLLFVAAVSLPLFAQQYPPRYAGGGIDGVYEFVSQRSSLTKPILVDDKDTISVPKWSGLWIFQKGYFSNVMMQSRRWEKVKEHEDYDLGYSSFAGTFTIKGDLLTLIESFSISQIFEGRPVKLRFRRQGNYLILIQDLRAHMEDGREGRLTTTLRKVR